MAIDHLLIEGEKIFSSKFVYQRQNWGMLKNSKY